MRAWLLASVLSVTTLLAACTVSAEQIRVAVFQGAGRVVVSSDRSVSVRLPGGERRTFASSLVLTPVPGGLDANGTPLPADVALFGFGETLAVWVEPAGGESPASGAAGVAASPAAPPDRVVVSGTLRVRSLGQGLTVINELDLEEYVKGVVPAEMSPTWHPEALKAQAVVARTYALYQRMLSRARDYDVVAGTQDQVYRGRRGVDDRVQQAVEETRGLVLTHDNAPILAAFSSTAAGPTEDAANVWSKDLPYLKGVDCPFDSASPYYQWRASVRLQEVEERLRQQGYRVGTVAAVTPFAWSRAGRVTRVRVLHSGGELILRGEDLRRVVGYVVIPSTQFEIEPVGPELVLTGRGAGHAVGLCQWGTKELAELGYPFPVILRYYFPGTELGRASSLPAPRGPSP